MKKISFAFSLFCFALYLALPSALAVGGPDPAPYCSTAPSALSTPSSVFDRLMTPTYSVVRWFTKTWKGEPEASHSILRRLGAGTGACAYLPFGLVNVAVAGIIGSVSNCFRPGPDPRTLDMYNQTPTPTPFPPDSPVSPRLVGQVDQEQGYWSLLTGQKNGYRPYPSYPGHSGYPGPGNTGSLLGSVPKPPNYQSFQSDRD